MVKVNLGSGYQGLEGWLNYDNSIIARFSRWPGVIRLLVKLGLLQKGYLGIKWPPIIIHDCRRGIPLDNDSVDFVYTSHFLEHLYRHEALAILRECRRVLKPGGVTRIAVPDLDKLVESYCKRRSEAFAAAMPDGFGGNCFADRFLWYLYAVERNCINPPSLLTRMMEPFLHRHKWMYNYESMAMLVSSAGLVQIERKRYREGSCADVQQLDVLPDETLYVEARRES